jgi:hypothetical protein
MLSGSSVHMISKDLEPFEFLTLMNAQSEVGARMNIDSFGTSSNSFNF